MAELTTIAILFKVYNVLITPPPIYCGAIKWLFDLRVTRSDAGRIQLIKRGEIIIGVYSDIFRNLRYHRGGTRNQAFVFYRYDVVGKQSLPPIHNLNVGMKLKNNIRNGKLIWMVPGEAVRKTRKRYISIISNNMDNRSVRE